MVDNNKSISPCLSYEQGGRQILFYILIRMSEGLRTKYPRWKMQVPNYKPVEKVENKMFDLEDG